MAVRPIGNTLSGSLTVNCGRIHRVQFSVQNCLFCIYRISVMCKICSRNLCADKTNFFVDSKENRFDEKFILLYQVN